MKDRPKNLMKELRHIYTVSVGATDDPSSAKELASGGCDMVCQHLIGKYGLRVVAGDRNILAKPSYKGSFLVQITPEAREYMESTETGNRFNAVIQMKYNQEKNPIIMSLRDTLHKKSGALDNLEKLLCV